MPVYHRDFMRAYVRLNRMSSLDADILPGQKSYISRTLRKQMLELLQNMDASWAECTCGLRNCLHNYLRSFACSRLHSMLQRLLQSRLHIWLFNWL